MFAAFVQHLYSGKEYRTAEAQALPASGPKEQVLADPSSLAKAFGHALAARSKAWETRAARLFKRPAPMLRLWLLVLYTRPKEHTPVCHTTNLEEARLRHTVYRGCLQIPVGGIPGCLER